MRNQFEKCGYFCGSITSLGKSNPFRETLNKARFSNFSYY
jgi:hypothetical protein